jgi:hypothetical protein
MTPAEYVQLKAFARIDGALLAALWVASFACYIIGLTNPFYGLLAMLLMVATPFFVAHRLRRFRDIGRDGIISMRRGWAYSVYVFFYAAILLALAQYVYFAFIDHGYLMHTFTQAVSTPEAQQMVKEAGMQQAITDGLEQLGHLRPIDYALNVLTVNIFLGIILGLPIGAIVQRRKVRIERTN